MIELWHSGFVPRPIDDVVQNPPAADEIVWLPRQGSFRFAADPFGLSRPEGVTVFAETWDYRVKRGEIHYFQYNKQNELIATGPALVTPFHLSYPFLIEEYGVLYMLPEAHRSGSLTLYRCHRFPDQWVPVKRLLDLPAIDATVVRYDGRWWMFYSLPGPDRRAMRELHVAFADDLMGPWQPHAANPVRAGLETSRPGGSPFVKDGKLHLPMQDCVTTYGAAVNVLRIDTLTPDYFAATPVARLEAGGLYKGFGDGFHTLSGHGDITFIDVKRLHRSLAEPLVKLQFKLNKTFMKQTARSVRPAELRLYPPSPFAMSHRGSEDVTPG